MSMIMVIPTYNEAENIECLINKVLASTDADLLIVDDDSPDGTGKIVESFQNERVHLLQRKKKRGLGAAYREGFSHALEKGYERIGQMDADFSHSPDSIPDLVTPLLYNGLVIGSRYIPDGKIHGWNAWRHFCSRWAIRSSRFLLRIPTKDVTSGFRCWSACLLKKVLDEPLKSNGYAFQEEMLFHAHRLGAPIVEVPITFKDRSAGRSKLGWKDVAEFFAVISRLRLHYGKLDKV